MRFLISLRSLLRKLFPVDPLDSFRASSHDWEEIPRHDYNIDWFVPNKAKPDTDV